MNGALILGQMLQGLGWDSVQDRTFSSARAARAENILMDGKLYVATFIILSKILARGREM